LRQTPRSNARAALVTAASTSAAPASTTCARRRPVAGLKTSSRAGDCPSRQPPSIKRPCSRAANDATSSL